MSSEVLDRRYRLVRPLAKVTSGGFVYAAEHVITRKWHAVKVLDANAPEKVRKRVRREMDALALAQGPGVVDFVDASETNDRAFLVTELLEGRTLAGLLAAKGTLDVGQTVRIAVDVAETLVHCHQRGVIHRDVKPANVFVLTDETTRLLDFGIAKLTRDEASREKLTQENTLVGTPEYMAPEALLMSPDTDARVDQYSLAVMLYECLTGAVPFEGSYGEVLKKVSTSPCKPLHTLRADVPIALDQLVKRAMSREPSERYGSMADLREAIARVPTSGASGAALFSGEPRSWVRVAQTVADAPIAKGKSGTGKRRHARAPYVTLARLTTESAGHVDGRVEEISESGFQFVGDRPVADGANVVARFALPVTGKIVEARATSRWKRSTRGLTATGFEFEGLPADALGEVRKYVAIMCSD